MWIFGGICKDQDNAIFVRIVPDRKRETLFPIIQECIAPGSMIHHDDWKPYRTIHQIPVVPPYQHEVVVHAHNFVDPDTGAHTQSIESAWNRMKLKLKNMLGCKRTVLDSYLDEFMWWHLHARDQTVETIMATFLRHIVTAWPRYNPELH